MASNGRLDVSQLVRAANGTPAQLLEKNTAAAWARMVADAAKDGITLRPEADDGVSSCYRNFDNQVHADQIEKQGGPTAATPGFSNHGWGTAIDIYMGPGVKAWLDKNAAKYGFSWTEGKASGESWHWVFVGGGSAVAGYSQVVADEQNFLAIARGEKLTVDGLLGPATAEAIKRYETFLRSYGYTGAIDGIWGQGVQAAHAKYYAVYSAPAAPASTGRATIKQGSSGQAVKDLQWTLNKNYPLYSKLAVDGIFGAGTANTVKEFQRRSGLTADGIVGPATWKALGL